MNSSEDKQGGLKAAIGKCLIDALSGQNLHYRTSPEGFIRWGRVQDDMNAAIDAAFSSFDAIDRNRALDEAVAVADAEWVAQNSLAGSKAARKIADGIRALKGTPVPESASSGALPKELIASAESVILNDNLARQGRGGIPAEGMSLLLAQGICRAAGSPIRTGQSAVPESGRTFAEELAGPCPVCGKINAAGQGAAVTPKGQPEQPIPAPAAPTPRTPQWYHCPYCGGALDTGNECTKCGADWLKTIEALELPAAAANPLPSESGVTQPAGMGEAATSAQYSGASALSAPAAPTSQGTPRTQTDFESEPVYVDGDGRRWVRSSTYDALLDAFRSASAPAFTRDEFDKAFAAAGKAWANGDAGMSGYLWTALLPLINRPISSNTPIIGYAVRMQDGPFVGIWTDKEMAEHVRSKQPVSHNDVVIPVCAAPMSSIAATVPAGWKFQSADFSMPNSGRVMFMRDAAGQKWWFSLTEEEQDRIPLYVWGEGATFEAAMEDARKNALAAPVSATEASKP